MIRLIMSDFRSLNNLSSLRAFDAVFQLGSVNKAAQSLFVTDGAVSRQIKQLEEAIGQPLFLRQHRRMVPTDLASALAEDVRAAFKRLEEVDRKVAVAPARSSLTIAAPATFLSRWLIPRQDSVKRVVGGTPLSFTTYHGPPTMAPTQVHVFISVGDASYVEGLPYINFMPQSLCLIVASSKYAEIRHDPNWAKKITRFTPASFPQIWSIWAERTKASGHKFEGQEVVMERMHYAIEAVEAGQGCSVVPKEFVERALSSKLLTAPIIARGNPEHYRCFIPERYSGLQSVQRVLSWLKREGSLVSI